MMFMCSPAGARCGPQSPADINSSCAGANWREVPGSSSSCAADGALREGWWAPPVSPPTAWAGAWSWGWALGFWHRRENFGFRVEREIVGVAWSCDCHLVGHRCMNVGDRGEFCSHFSLVVCVTVASSPVKEIFCCTVPVLMGIIVLAEHTEHHRGVWLLLKAAFATALLKNHKD